MVTSYFIAHLVCAKLKLLTTPTLIWMKKSYAILLCHTEFSGYTRHIFLFDLIMVYFGYCISIKIATFVNRGTYALT